MTIPLDTLKIETQLDLFSKYWKTYINDLVGHKVNGGIKPLTFGEWWVNLQSLSINLTHTY